MEGNEIARVALTERLFGMFVGSCTVVVVYTFAPEDWKQWLAWGAALGFAAMAIWDLLEVASTPTIKP